MAEEEVKTVGSHRHLSTEDLDSDEESANILTAANAADLCPKAYRLVAENQGFTELQTLSTLSQLDYIKLSNNALKTLEGLQENWRIKTLIARNNRLESVQAILKHASIRILDLSDNRLPSIDWLRHSQFAPELLTLIFTGNSIRSLDGILSLRQVRTLVLSHNDLEDISALCKLRTLEKLSVSHNQIRKIPAELASLEKMPEFRVSHNKISELPAPQTLRQMPALRIFDVGNNRIQSFESLAACPQLVNVSLRENAAAAREDLRTYVRTLCSSVEIIDNVRLHGGRRKLRINRLRHATGLPTEGDRKFARAPPAHAVQSMPAERRKGPQELDETTRAEGMRVLQKEELERTKHAHEREEGGGNGPAPERSEGASGLKRLREGDADAADDEIETSVFLEQARASTMPKSMGGAQAKVVHKISKAAKRKKLDAKPVISSENGRLWPRG